MEEKRYIGYEIKSISHLIRRKLDVTFSAPEYDGMTGVQHAIMGYIMRHAKQGEVFQRDIEKEFSLRRSTVTVMLQGLEQKGYILREPVSRDGRLKKIILTEKAQKLQERTQSEMERFHQALEEPLSEEEKEQLFFLLGKIKQNLIK